MTFVKDGEIVLNLSMNAVRNLMIDNDAITCSGRFGGIPHDIYVPMSAVMGIFAKETGQGLVFQGHDAEPLLGATENRSTEQNMGPGAGSDDSSPPPPDKPRLRIVK